MLRLRARISRDGINAHVQYVTYNRMIMYRFLKSICEKTTSLLARFEREFWIFSPLLMSIYNASEQIGSSCIFALMVMLLNLLRQDIRNMFQYWTINLSHCKQIFNYENCQVSPLRANFNEVITNINCSGWLLQIPELLNEPFSIY